MDEVEGRNWVVKVEARGGGILRTTFADGFVGTVFVLERRIRHFQFRKAEHFALARAEQGSVWWRRGRFSATLPGWICRSRAAAAAGNMDDLVQALVIKREEDLSKGINLRGDSEDEEMQGFKRRRP